MPPVLDTLRAIFPDALPQQASDGDEPVAALGGTEEGKLQSAGNGSESYNSRISTINAKVKKMFCLQSVARKVDAVTQSHLFGLRPVVDTAVVTQYSTEVEVSSQQQQYLRLQQDQARKADEDSLVQADSGGIQAPAALLYKAGFTNYSNRLVLQNTLLAGERLDCLSSHPT